MTTSTPFTPLIGGCACSYVRYSLELPPLILHTCHCHCCQRETGCAFVLNYLTETSSVLITTQNIPLQTIVPSASGLSQTISRCPKCHIALWSHYNGAGPALAFVRSGTLDVESKARLWGGVESGAWKMVHIYTDSKVPWVELPKAEGTTFKENYSSALVWPKESLERRDRIFALQREHAEE